MLKITLLRPINPSGSAYLKRFGFLPVPLGLIDLASMVADKNWAKVNIIDMEADDLGLDEVAEKIIDYGTDILGVTIHATSSHNVSLDIVKEVKEQKPVLAVAGGHHATFLPRTLIKDGFDVVVLGEGEGAFRELVENYYNGYPFDDINGIVYRNGENIVYTRKRKLIHDLDSLPLPTFELIDKSKYRFDLFGYGQYVGAMETSRGCPYACDFCSVTPTWGNIWRNKSNERILKELEILHKLGYNWVFFVDDIFIVQTNIKQRSDLFDKIIEKNYDMKFIVQMRADITSRYPELINKASQAGVKIAFIGAESGSPEVLKKMHKGIIPNQTIQAIRNLKKADMIVLVGTMMGAPYERFRDLWATFRMSRKLAKEGADALQVSIYTPLPGTRIMRDALENNLIIQGNWDGYDILTPVIKTRVGTAISQLMQLYTSYSFYFYKYIYGKIHRFNISRENELLIKNATQFMMNELNEYVREVLNLPRILLKTRLLESRAAKIPEGVVKELLESLQQPVYDTEGRKNPYFMVKSNI